MRSRDPERIAEFLGSDLVWEGLEPGLRSDGRQQVMSVIRNRFAAAPLIVQAVEGIEVGQHVIMGLCGLGFDGKPGDLETVGQIFNVFTLSEGKVVRWRDFLLAEKRWPRMPKTALAARHHMAQRLDIILRPLTLTEM